MKSFHFLQNNDVNTWYDLNEEKKERLRFNNIGREEDLRELFYLIKSIYSFQNFKNVVYLTSSFHINEPVTTILRKTYKSYRYSRCKVKVLRYLWICIDKSTDN